MKLVRYIIEYNEKVAINNEYTTTGPLVVEWFAGNDLAVHPAGQTIKINENTFIIRPKVGSQEKPKEKIEKLGTVLGHVRVTNAKESYIAIKDKAPVPTDLELPFAFLQCVQYGDFENARAMLSFEITDAHLREYFGEYEVLINNYLGDPELVSILPAGADAARTFKFQIRNGKIINIE